jgi:antitoxin component of MazEF toxin-antitoxin module
MKTMELKVARIGNSRGIRLPADTLRRYHIIGAVLMEERLEGILLHPKSPPAVEKLSWEETSRQMAESQEDWSAWDTVANDGLAEIPWQRKTAIVADRHASYGTKPRRGRKARKGVAL